MSIFPKISVLMCAHKVDDYLFESISSVLNSTFENIELILVANGLECAKIKTLALEAFGEDNRLKVILTPIPQLSYALNRGLEACSSDYVARLDSDDICEENRFEIQLSYLLETQSDIVGSGCKLINKDGIIIGERFYPEFVTRSSFIYKNPVCHPSVMFRRTEILKIRGYNAGFSSEDYDLWLRAISAGLKVRNVAQCLIRYRVHSDSTQGSLLAYAEVCSHYLREFLISPCFSLFFGFLTSLFKVIIARVKTYFRR